MIESLKEMKLTSFDIQAYIILSLEYRKQSTTFVIRK